jgi:hypothetical protein
LQINLAERSYNVPKDFKGMKTVYHAREFQPLKYEYPEIDEIS